MIGDPVVVTPDVHVSVLPRRVLLAIDCDVRSPVGSELRPQRRRDTFVHWLFRHLVADLKRDGQPARDQTQTFDEAFQHLVR